MMVLGFLIIIGMLKEGLADYKRFKTDKLSNALPTELVTGALLDDNPKAQAKYEQTTGDTDPVR